MQVHPFGIQEGTIHRTSSQGVPIVFESSVSMSLIPGDSCDWFSVGPQPPYRTGIPTSAISRGDRVNHADHSPTLLRYGIRCDTISIISGHWDSFFVQILFFRS